MDAYEHGDLPRAEWLPEVVGQVKRRQAIAAALPAAGERPVFTMWQAAFLLVGALLVSLPFGGWSV